MSNRILIVEDDYNLASALSAKFSIFGYIAQTHNGSGSMKDLINAIVIGKPDYIILDIVMPDLNGFDIMKRLKTDPFLNKIIIFIYTNLNDENSRKKGELYAPEHYFVKSEIDTDNFVDKVVKIVKNREKINNDHNL